MAILIAALVNSVTGQMSEAEKALAPVRSEDRPPLIRLVNDYVRFQQSQQWGNLYDILSPTYTQGETRSDFIGRLQSSHGKGQYSVILDFSLKRTYGNDPFHGEYSFYGCANVFADGKKQLANTHLDVVLENGAWRVSFVGLFTTCPSPELECKNAVNWSEMPRYVSSGEPTVAPDGSIACSSNKLVVRGCMVFARRQ